MIDLLISSIDGLPVFQVGTSNLSGKNKSVDGTKLGDVNSKKELIKKLKGKKKKSTVKSIDLGVSEETYTFRCKVNDPNIKNKILNICRVKKFCKINDKFKGEISAYITDYGVEDSDQRVNTTIFDLTCIVQFDEKTGVSTVAYDLELLDKFEEFQKKMTDAVNKIRATTSDIRQGFSRAKKGLFFVDSALNILSAGVSLILTTKAQLKNTALSVVARQERLRGLTKSLLNLKNAPNELMDFFLSIAEDIATKWDNVVPIYKVDIDRDNLSIYEIRELEREQTASEIVNIIKVQKDIRFILSGDFADNETFQKVVNETIDRMGYVGFSEEERFEFIKPIIFFANEQKFNVIIEEEIKEPKPLLLIVYEKYESIERYEEVLELNNIDDPSYVSGKVKFYA